ncbi:hypothetical protein [Aurantibacillus circumpalustris]|uniref:hypothetical protein n=1 Tax=Aurantibacillus circumpalustris TaxID=3036359 RepID=UPI00295B50F5|nr:hypothetical protein [Aurantibacillus circumpalustris]
MKTSLNIAFLFIFSLLSKVGFSQSVDEIVNKHIEAIGGKDNWAKIKTLKIERVMKAQGAEIKFTIYQIDKKALRQDISVMGMTGFSIIKNSEGWSYMPWRGQSKSEAMTADDVKNSQDELSIQDEFMNYKELGKSLDYYGMDDIDGTECHKLKMIDKDEKETTFYIDPASYLILKKTEKVQANGQENEMSSYYSDHKKTDEGVMFPMSVSSGWGESEIVKLEVNPKIDESLFKPTK